MRWGRSEPVVEEVVRLADIAGRTVAEMLPGATDPDWYTSRLPRPARSTPEIDARVDRLGRLRERLDSAPARREAAGASRDSEALDDAVEDERALPDQIWRLEQDVAAARAEHLKAEAVRVPEEARSLLADRLDALRWLREYVGREYGLAFAAETAARTNAASLSEEAAAASTEVDRLWERRMRANGPRPGYERIDIGMKVDPFARAQYSAPASTTVRIHTPRDPRLPERVTTTSSS